MGRTAEKSFKFSKPGEVRTRFAPSPTGFLHIGSARTALFNYIFPKKNNGRFILRIEDTDKERSEEPFEKDIIENLKWLGLEWDEGPGADGKFGPYKQSERTEIYKKYLEKLLEEKKAYYCFCPGEELEAKRQDQLSRGLSYIYNGKCAGLSGKEVEKNLAAGIPGVIRFKVPVKKVHFNDLIRGKVEFDSSLIGDFTIAKDLNTPLYNFTVVVDDFEMKITHVIRGEDHISNTPKQILLQEALGFNQPEYAHLPLILATDRTKLSKRHGAVSVAEYRKDGYLPEALINFLAFLGWNPGTNREIYSLNALIKDFAIEKTQKGGAVFNIKKLDFINGFYIRKKTIDELTLLCLPYLIEKGLIKPVPESNKDAKGLVEYFGKEFLVNETEEKISFDYLKKVVMIYQERLKKLSEIIDLTEFFFADTLNYEKDLLRWKNMEDVEIKNVLAKAEKILSEIKENNWDAKNLEKILMPEAEEMARVMQKAGDRGYFLWPLRAALTGKKYSAGPFEIVEILEKEKTLKRINEAIKKL